MFSMCLIILFRYIAYYCPLIKTPFTVHVTAQDGLKYCHPHSVLQSCIRSHWCLMSPPHTKIGQTNNMVTGDFFVNILIIIQSINYCICIISNHVLCISSFFIVIHTEHVLYFIFSLFLFFGTCIVVFTIILKLKST